VIDEDVDKPGANGRLVFDDQQAWLAVHVMR
jgi:hypothetical protein